MLQALINWLPLPFWVVGNWEFASVPNPAWPEAREGTPAEFPGYHLHWAEPDKWNEWFKRWRIPVKIAEMTENFDWDKDPIVQWGRDWHELRFHRWPTAAEDRMFWRIWKFCSREKFRRKVIHA